MHEREMHEREREILQSKASTTMKFKEKVVLEMFKSCAIVHV